MVGVINIQEMTLRDIDDTIRLKEHQLEYYLEEKERAFNNTQPKAVIFKQDKIFSSTGEDKCLNYVITIEELDLLIDDIQDQISSLKHYFEAEVKRIGKYEPLIQKIINMRQMKFKWYQIAEATNYCESNCRRLYSIEMGKRDIY